MHVGLFVTCLVDMFRPSVGFATIKLLTDAGCTVAVPEAQVCCGQPALNSGDRRTTADIAKQVIPQFEGFDAVVVPSGSCAGTIVKDYVETFQDDPDWAPRARRLAAKTWELTQFLVDVLKVDRLDATVEGRATYHDSCSGLRSLKVKQQPRHLLAQVKGLELVEMADSEVCCGFGGTFCVKYPEISDKLVSDKTRSITDSGAEMLLAGDVGCLMNMAGKLTREGRPVAVRHVAEVLAGMTDTPPIAQGRASGVGLQTQTGRRPPDGQPPLSKNTSETEAV